MKQIRSCFLLAYYENPSVIAFLQEVQQEEEASREPAMPMTPFCSSRAYMYEECQVSEEQK